MSEPWLSVIVPTYNGSAYLADALNSIKAQRDDNIEIVAVDDGSRDTTPEIFRAYEARLPLRLYARSHTGNWVANTNYALARTRANHVCLLHQDDMWLPNRLTVLRGILDREPELALLLHPAHYINARGRGLGPWRCPLMPGRQAKRLFVERLLIQNFIAMPAPVFPRTAALRIGGFNERLWYTADWDFWLRLAQVGPIWYHPRPLAAFRIHDQSQTAQGVSRAADMRRQMEMVLKEHLPLCKVSCSDRRELGRVAELSLEVNHALAVAANGGMPSWRRLMGSFLGVGLSGGRRFLRDSRILERLGARLRARLL